jgi:hypothetical protein
LGACGCKDQSLSGRAIVVLAPRHLDSSQQEERDLHVCKEGVYIDGEMKKRAKGIRRSNGKGCGDSEAPNLFFP